MLRMFGIKLKLLIYRMQLVVQVSPTNQLLVAGHFLVKPVVNNVLFLKIILNGGKCRRLVQHISWLFAICISVYQRSVHIRGILTS